ncbi:insulinase family protein [Aliidiomarina indica]|uniref:insulinase family protein n=1 Tax=Aliidiomarina indica TaxID=2749147 RepID=UPI00188ED045|nr:insulinase family protein [Aliidiomarina indica]
MSQSRSTFVPDSSLHDHQGYRWIWLPNNFPVLLVHMPEAQHSAASFAVNAGHFHDPDNAPGIAHFLEHILFLGSERWPDPDAFGQFVQQQGGHYNAWTGTEHSNFYFSVQADAFAEGLERFHSLLHEPCFDPAWVEKERQSIEAEYRLKRKDELRRLYEVHKVTANKKHPFAKFSVGNAQTLADQPDLSIRERLIEYYQTHYQPQHSTLVLVGPQSLDHLAQLARDTFDPFANRQTESTRCDLPDEPMYLPEQLGSFIYVRPIKQASRLIITFPLPDINHDYLHKTTSFIAHLLGYEGPGSLCHWLREQLWITELSAGGGMSGYNFKDFTLNLQLTDAGMLRIDTILQACFQFIRTVAKQGLEPELYAERQKMIGLAYRFPESVRPVDLASQLSINMLHYHPDHVISGDYRMDGLNLEFAEQLLALMRPERCRVTVIHQSVPVSQRSKYYHAEYSTIPIRSDQLEQYQRDLTDIRFQVPKTNPYIPERLDPLALEAVPNSQQDDTNPRLYAKAPGVKLWHLQETELAVPHAHIYLSLQLPLSNASARNHAISRMWCELGQDALNEQFYDAEVAGIHFNLYTQSSGITLHIAGFSDRQPDLFKDLVTTLAALRPNAEQFYTARDQMRRNWEAMHQHKPINYLFSILHHKLQYGAFTAQQLADSIADLDYEHYLNLLPGMLRDAQAILLIYGDSEATTARHLAHWVSENFPVVAKPKTPIARHVSRLEEGVVEASFYSAHTDHACAWFYQGRTTDMAEKASFLMLNQLLSPRFFNALRTERQLGYLVGSSYVPMHGLPGLLCYIQSPSHNAEQLSDEMTAFAGQFVQELQALDDDAWEKAKHAILTHLGEKSVGLRSRAQRMWSSIINNQGEFGLAERIMEQVHTLEKGDFVRFAAERLVHSPNAMVMRSTRDQS